MSIEETQPINTCVFMILGLKPQQLGVIRQLLAALCGSLSILSVSSSFVWIAPLLVRLRSPNSELPLTADQGSWIVSLIELGDLIATIPAGFIVDRIGRKTMLLATGPMFVFSWILILSTRSVEIVYIVRVIQGVALGMQFTALPLYLAEIAGTEIRGTIGYFFQGMWYVGNLYEYSLGPYVTYQQLAWFSLIPPIMFILTFSWFPESPYILVMKGQEEEAVKALQWLRGAQERRDVEAELDTMKKSMAEDIETRGSWRDLVTTPEGRRALILIHMVGMAYTMSGGTAMFSYATDTFHRTTAGALSPDSCTIIMGTVVLLFVPFSGLAVDRFGRRPVLLLSCLGSALILLVGSLFFYIRQDSPPTTDASSWIPIATVISYTVLIGAGVEAIFPVLQAELFPNSTRGVAAGLSHFNMTLMSFFCLKMYQVIADGVGLYALYLMFAFFAVFGAVLIYFFVPETKGKTFWEVQQLLKK